MKYIDVYRNGVFELTKAKIPEAELDARLLLEYVCNTDRNTLYAHPEKEISTEQHEVFLKLLKRRINREPLQYITGFQDFMGLNFKVDGNVLIPRQDTEILVEEAMKLRSDKDSILDMCTGSGCILISLLYYSNDCRGIGADISKEALYIADQNAQRLLASKKDETSISFVQSDLFENISGQFDLIVSNPPYIRTEEIKDLMPEVAKYEPRMALDGKNDGLWFYERITEKLNTFLKPGGKILYEIGFDQGKDVSRILSDKGFKYIEIIKDYSGLDRVVRAEKPIL